MQKKSHSIVSTLIAGSIGNTVEWYNFLVYGSLASYLAQSFFPQHNYTVSLLLIYITFAIGFIARPLGGLIFGHIGDKFGRRKALLSSLALMIVITSLMVLLPTYQKIGLFAPLLLLILRFMQGISVGGEYTSALVFLNEHAKPSNRGLVISFIPATINFGILLGAFVAAIAAKLFSHTQMLTWGWRLVFLVGVMIAVVGLILRLNMAETPVFNAIVKAGDLAKNIYTELLKHTKNIIFLFLLVGYYSVKYQIIYIWLPTFLHLINQLPLSSGLLLVSINIALLILLLPWAGYLCDKVGAKRMLILGCLLDIILGYPCYLLLISANIIAVYLGLFFFTVSLAIFSPAMPALMPEIFPAKIRISAISLSFNLAYALLGGTAPLVATGLIMKLHNHFAPIIYLLVTAVLALIAIFNLRPYRLE